MLSVSDTGDGTPERAKSRLDPSSPSDHGAGLGLFVCSSVVERNGGHLVAQSSRDKGTTFDIYLPRTN